MTEKLPYGEISRLAHHSGYSQQMIGRILSGYRRPYWRSDKFQKLLDFTGTESDLWRIGTPQQIIAGIIAEKRKRLDA